MLSRRSGFALLMGLTAGWLASGCGSQATDSVSPVARDVVSPARGGGGGGGGVPAPPPPTTTPLTITTTVLGNGNVGSAYTDFVIASGGSGSPDRFRIVSGRLPNGLTMASALGIQSTAITGTPTTAGTSSFTVQVQDPAGNSATRVLSITVLGVAPLVINNQSPILAPGTVGASYAIGLFAIGGSPPVTWSIVAGALPPGLRLSGNIISGTPTTAGTFSFTAREIGRASCRERV